MTTVLEKSLKRELEIGPDHYTLTISPDGLKLVPKGKRNGVELKWLDLVSGDAALAVALNASLARLPVPGPAKPSAQSAAAPFAATPRKAATRAARKPAQTASRVRTEPRRKAAD